MFYFASLRFDFELAEWKKDTKTIADLNFSFSYFRLFKNKKQQPVKTL
jgi:hypothetical protein